MQEDTNHNFRISLSKTESDLANMMLIETDGDWEETDAGEDTRSSRKRLSEALEVLEKNSEDMREKYDVDANGEEGSGRDRRGFSQYIKQSLHWDLHKSTR